MNDGGFEISCSLTKAPVVTYDPESPFGRAMAARMKTIEAATAAIAKLEAAAVGLRDRIAGNEQVIADLRAQLAAVGQRKGEHA